MGFSYSMKNAFEELYASRSQAILANDPLSFCHRYRAPEDREIAAFVASSLAYGAVPVIKRSLETVFSAIGPSPRKFVERIKPDKAVETFSLFKHRFNDGRDIAALLWAAHGMLRESGSINGFFLATHDPSAGNVAGSLAAYCERAISMDYSQIFPGAEGVPASFRFLFPSPASGSACKRLCMFLRWVVRPADGIDLGLWQGVSPSMLVVPVDVHIARIGRWLGLAERVSPDWKMAVEITDSLKKLDPEDPVKYDFVLCHLGISGGCDGSSPEPCDGCRVLRFCSSKAAKGAGGALTALKTGGVR